MFIYLVALVATIFLIFGLLHARYLNDWLQSSVRCSLTLYNGLIRRPAVGDTLNNENLEDSLAEQPVILINDRVEFEEMPATRIIISNKEKLCDVNLKEGVKPFQLETAQVVESRTSKQEEKENMFEMLKNSIEKTSPNSSSRLNTRQIYNLLTKEMLKENEARQKLLNNDKSNFNETMADTREYLPSSSENGAELEDTSNK